MSQGFTKENTTGGGAGHAELHTVASHSDTTATGAELETLTDGSNADSLHVHANAGISGDLDNVARTTVRKNTGGADVGSRRRLNFIEGSNVTLTITDDAAGEEIDITIASTGGGSSPLTTKGDIFTYDTADARLPVGTNGQVLTADSAEATGLKWATASGGGGGQDITFIDKQETTTDPGTTLVITKPTGLQVNDVMVMFVTVNGGSGVITTPPTGWSVYQEQADTDPGAAHYTGIYYRVATASDVAASNFTWTQDAARRAGGCIVAYRYVDPVTPLDVSAPAVAEGNSNSPQAPAITTVTDGAMVIIAFGMEDDQASTAPTGYAERYDVQITGGTPATFVQGALADKIVATAGTETPGAWTTAGNDGWIAQTMALRPYGTDLDKNALHVNVPNEITAIDEKTSVVGNDEFVIEDSAASGEKKSMKFSTMIPTGGTAGQVLKKDSSTDYDYSWAADATGSGSVPDAAADDEMLFPHTTFTSGWTSERFMLNVCSDEFGADPTGVSDSAAAFREAIDWIDTNRGGFGTIYVPQGHYNFTTTESVSIRSVSRNVHVHVHEGIHILGAGFGSGRSQGAGDNQLAPTTIRSTSGTPYAIFAMHATGDTPDWRGASIRQLHIKDDSASNNAVDHAILVSGGLIYSHIENVSISNIEKSTGWPIRYVRADNNQPSQYGRITDVIISRSYNGVWLDGNAPDMIMTRISALRDGLTAGNGTGLLIESSKVTVRDCEFQFYDVCVEVGNASDNRGKHILLENIHIEGDTGVADGTYASALKMTGTTGQDELPIVQGIDLGNGAKFTNWLELVEMTDCRIYDFRIRDNKWLGVQSTDAKFDVTNSTGLIDGADLTT